MLRKCVSQDILLAFRFQCWMHTWVMVTWSRRNCRSFRRTSKLALAFCRFFCRRSVAYTKDCQINNFFNKCKINNYSSCFIKGKKKKNPRVNKSLSYTSSREYSNITFAPSHKHTESVSSIQAREYMPSDTSKSAIRACNEKVSAKDVSWKLTLLTVSIQFKLYKSLLPGKKVNWKND